MTELFDTVYQDTEPIVERLLYPGVYLFAGAPKKGKSYVMLQIAYQICMGEPLWEHPVRQGPCLYLALEDHFSRLQRRLYQMYGTNPADQLFLAVLAKQIGDGLEGQIERFVREHADTKLVIIDTLQKVRPSKGASRNEYAADYEAVTPLKQLADQLGICIMLVHHTRKQDADDPFDTVSGTNGIHGSVDGTFLYRRSRGQTPVTATIDVTGRDVADISQAGRSDHALELRSCGRGFLGRAARSVVGGSSGASFAGAAEVERHGHGAHGGLEA